MKKYFNILKNNVLFKGFEPVDLENILRCLSGRAVSYKKNDIIILSGAPVDFVGIVLSGSIKIMKDDIEGNTNILTKLGANDIFAEAFAYAGISESPVTVQAEENCEILFIDCKKIIKSCHNACSFHSRLIENMLSLVAKKNIMLNQKIEIISKRTTREKLLMYLEIQKRIMHSSKFTIPYNRGALAHYLCLDRSAMSRELCKMRDEGLIKFNKNEFEIL
ncbi:MAG TPA: Crp/Fnr family transcriptional regulator [Clostridia bacterium]|nr:Crp/Fnr family transcriptional regulator [Clostridia bacterium]